MPGSTLSAALILASLAAVMALGHDGLALTLGAVGSVYLASVVFVPISDAHSPADGWPQVIASRSGSATVGLIASVLLLASLAICLAAEIKAVALALRMIEQPVLQAAALLPAGLLFAVVAVKRGLTDRLAPLIALAVLLAIVATLIAATTLSGDGLGGVVSSPTLSNIAALEQALLDKRLADPATFKPFAVPFLRTDVWNFLALASSLAIGLALLATPHRDRTTRASQTLLVLAILALLLVPPLAAQLKVALLAAVDSGVRVAAVPEWIVAGSRVGAIDVCRGSGSAEAAAIAKACGKGFGPQGLLKWQDLSFLADASPFVGLAAAGLPKAALILLVAGLALAAAWTATCITAHAHAQGSRIAPALVILAAGAVAAFDEADIATLIATAAAISAGGLGPTVIAAVFSRRLPPRATILAMTLGALAALVLTTAPRFAPLATFAMSGSAATAPQSLVRKLASLRDTIATVPDGPGRIAARQQSEKLARDAISWFGLKPAASGILGLTLGAVVLILGMSLSRRRPVTV